MHLTVCWAEFNDSILVEVCNLPVPRGWPCKIRWQLVLWRVPSATSAGFSETSHCFNSMFNMTLSHTLFPSMKPPLSLIPLTPATYSCPSSSPKSLFLKCSALHLSEGFYSSNSKKGLLLMTFSLAAPGHIGFFFLWIPTIKPMLHHKTITIFHFFSILWV